MTAEQARLEAARDPKNFWKNGGLISERQWGTVREDYSGNGDAWNHAFYRRHPEFITNMHLPNQPGVAGRRMSGTRLKHHQKDRGPRAGCHHPGKLSWRVGIHTYCV